MDIPTIYTSRQLSRYFKEVQTSTDGKTWEPTRGTPFWGIGLRRRIKAAWLVFTGRADVIKWDA